MLHEFWIWISFLATRHLCLMLRGSPEHNSNGTIVALVWCEWKISVKRSDWCHHSTNWATDRSVTRHSTTDFVPYHKAYMCNNTLLCTTWSVFYVWFVCLTVTSLQTAKVEIWMKPCATRSVPLLLSLSHSYYISVSPSLSFFTYNHNI